MKLGTSRYLYLTRLPVSEALQSHMAPFSTPLLIALTLALSPRPFMYDPVLRVDDDTAFP